MPDATIAGMPSVMYDAASLPGGEKATEALTRSGDALHFVLKAFVASRLHQSHILGKLLDRA